jgi:ring-1,2-phenylacetyl-CoA epoxidase subunit PaaB
MSEQKNTQGKLWEVFIQANPGISHKHAGSLHAADAETALQNARDVYTRRSEGISIWVVPSNEIVSSSNEDSGAFFEPANDKIYRHPTFYTIPDGVKYL